MGCHAVLLRNKAALVVITWMLANLVSYCASANCIGSARYRHVSVSVSGSNSNPENVHAKQAAEQNGRLSLLKTSSMMEDLNVSFPAVVLHFCLRRVNHRRVWASFHPSALRPKWICSGANGTFLIIHRFLLCESVLDSWASVCVRVCPCYSEHQNMYNTVRTYWCSQLQRCVGEGQRL